jgi:hypothetical protein
MRALGLLFAGAAAGAALYAAPASAASSWDLSSSALCTQIVGTGSTCIGSGSGSATNGNVYQFKADDNQLITAEAFRTTSSAGTSTLAANFLGFYGGNGLGVENLSANEHAVDNASGAADFVVFKFPAAFDTLSIKLSPFGSTQDMDASIMFGTPTGTLSGITGLSGFSGVKISDIFASTNGGTVNGFTRFDSNTAASSSLLTITPPQPNQEIYLIVAASLTNPDAVVDYFKINAITGSKVTTSVPEPSSLSVLLMGAAAVYYRRRKAQRKSTPTAA